MLTKTEFQVKFIIQYIFRLSGIALLCCFGFCYTVYGQTSTEVTFGQNRVQYKDFIFSYYKSDNFTTYFYQGGQDIAKYVIKTAEDDAEDIAKMLDFRYKRKIDIIIYNSITELNQTNIGIYDPPQNPGGNFKIPEGKIFIYFNGDHRNLEAQIREGIARIYIDKMVRGTGFAEVIQNAVLLNLPDWYRQGLIRYIGENWNTEAEDHLRDGILSGRYKKLNKLKPNEAVFVGQSIWHYIEEVHGKAALNNIIYLTRINRSVDNGFLFVLGTNLNQTLEEWYKYYYARFTNEAKISSMPPDNSVIKTKFKKDIDYYQPRLSTDGKYIAYASNDMGRYKVYLLNTETGKRKTILRGGFRTNTQWTDESIPLIAFDPDGKKVAIIRDRRAVTYLILYDLEKHKKEILPVRKFQKVVSFNFVDSKQLVMSAVQNGQTDIYLYTIASTTTRKLTDDYYDDLYPAYINADSVRGIMFSSNREGDTVLHQRYESQLLNKQLDLYFYDLDANQDVLYRVTNTPYANETYPQNFNDTAFCFLSDANGIRNRYTGHFERIFDHNQKTYRVIIKETGEMDSIQVAENVPLDSAIDRSQETFKDSITEKVYRTGGVSSVYTNYSHGILEQSVVPGKNLALDFFLIKNRPQFRKYDLASNSSNGKAPEMEYMLRLEQNVNKPKSSEKKSEVAAITSASADSIRSNRGKRPFDFQSEFDYGVKLFDWDSAAASRQSANGENGYVFRFSKVRPYFVRFMVDDIVAQLNNDPIILPYQPFDPSQPEPALNSLGVLFKLGVTDLLEDYKIYGGLSLPFQGLNGNNNYFITYENLRKRLDKKFTYYRSSQSSTTYTTFPFTTVPVTNPNGVDYSIKTNYFESQLKYPLDVLNSFRFIFNFRNDKVVYKAEDSASLLQQSISDNWLGARAEYVFDNCIEVLTNVRYGTRFKVYVETQKEFPAADEQISSNFSLPAPQWNNKIMGIIGFDLRHYIKIYKQIIWANRLSGAGSFGTAKMIYYLGGYDNWITSPSFQKFDYNTPIDYNNNYAFQTLETPLRGFLQNARNGDKYLLFNSELRVPIFSALINNNIKSEIIRNFEIIGFFDAGTAWEGLSPFSNSNPLFNEEIPNTPENPSVVVDLKQNKSPIIMGFGPGFRTSLLGYFIKFDVAWGYDTGIVSPNPRYYLTLGLDF
jgi:hypothetical protein